MVKKNNEDYGKKRIILYVDDDMKKNWKEWSKNTLQTSLSQMIRQAVKEYQRNYEKLDEPSLNTEIQNELMKLKYDRNEEIESYKTILKEMKDKVNKKNNTREIKDQILSLLELEPINTKTIALRIRLDLFETSNILKELYDNKLIELTENIWELI